MIGTGVLVGVAVMIVTLGFSVLIYRIQRELKMHERGEIVWIATADWLMVVATAVSILFVLLPVSIGDVSAQGRLPTSAAAFGLTLTLGFVPAILAHYRLILGGSRQGPRTNPEPGEALVVAATLVTAILVAAVVALCGTGKVAGG